MSVRLQITIDYSWLMGWNLLKVMEWMNNITSYIKTIIPWRSGLMVAWLILFDSQTRLLSFTCCFETRIFTASKVFTKVGHNLPSGLWTGRPGWYSLLLDLLCLFACASTRVSWPRPFKTHRFIRGKHAKQHGVGKVVNSPIKCVSSIYQKSLYNLSKF